MMTHSIRRATVVVAAAALAVVCAHTATHAQQAPTVKRTVLLQHDTSVPGYEAVLVSVEIPAGGREGRHTHSGLAMIHVEEGTLTLDYEGSRPSATSRRVLLRRSGQGARRDEQGNDAGQGHRHVRHPEGSSR